MAHSMNYKIDAVPENLLADDGFRYVIRFDNFTITSNKSYKAKITATKKAREHLEELRKEMNKPPEMVICICG